MVPADDVKPLLEQQPGGIHVTSLLDDDLPGDNMLLILANDEHMIHEVYELIGVTMIDLPH